MITQGSTHGKANCREILGARHVNDREGRGAVGFGVRKRNEFRFTGARTERLVVVKCLALDIGGAYLKAADGDGHGGAHYFPMWKTPQRLPDALRTIISELPPAEQIVASMTGELADCFRTKAEGVTKIVEGLLSAADGIANGNTVRIYMTDGQFVAPRIALQDPLKAAASNWHALASFCCQFVRTGTALLVDIGSTTTDLVPLSAAGPIAQGHTDPARLACGELVYTGVERSPVCAVVDAFPWQGRLCPTAHEVFATTCDAYVILGELPEDSLSKQTADGRALTQSFALERLARSICADRDMFDVKDARVAAERIRRAQLERIACAAREVIGRLTQPPETVILSGQGEFLARELVDWLDLPASIVSLGDRLGHSMSRVATAHALAVLARKRNHP